MNLDEWSRMWERLRQRWPRWEPTPMQVEDFRREFQNRDPLIFEATMCRVLGKFSSEEPKMAWFTKAYFEAQEGVAKSAEAERRAKQDEDRGTLDSAEREAIAMEDRSRAQRLNRMDEEDRMRAGAAVAAKGFVGYPPSTDANDWSYMLRGLACANLDSENP